MRSFLGTRFRAVLGRRGVILLSVSWIVLILSLLLLSQLKVAELGFEDISYAEKDFRLRMAAKSSLNRIFTCMALDVTEGEKEYDAYSDPWGWVSLQDAFGEDSREVAPDIHINVSIEDEESKINPSTHSPERISALFQAVGLGKIEADELALSIKTLTEETQRMLDPGNEQSGDLRPISFESVDLRYLTDLRSVSADLLYGEDLNFNNALDKNEDDGKESFPYDDRNGLLRKGLTRLLSLRGGDSVNPNLAPLEVLLTVPGISETIAEEIVLKRLGADNVPGTEDDFVFKKPGDLLALSSLSRFREFEYARITPHVRMTSNIFTVRVCATSDRSAQMFRIQACIERNDKGVVKILSWLEDNGV